MTRETLLQRQRILHSRHLGLRTERDNEKDSPDPNQDKIAELNVKMFVLEGRLLELQEWMGWLDKYPPITRPDQLPTTGTMLNIPPWESMPDDDVEAIAERLGGHKRIAEELAESLPTNGAH